MDDSNVPQERLLLYLSRKPKLLRGDQYLIELVSNVEQRIHCSQFRYFDVQQGNGTQELNNEQSFSETSGFTLGNGWFETPVEMTDQRTLKDCFKRLKQLDREMENIKDWNDYGQLQDLMDEKATLLEYIRVCRPAIKNGIKVLKDKIHEDYRAVCKAIKRSLDQIAKDKPDLVPFIRQHLVVGIFCVWRC